MYYCWSYRLTLNTLNRRTNKFEGPFDDFIDLLYFQLGVEYFCGFVWPYWLNKISISEIEQLLQNKYMDYILFSFSSSGIITLMVI